MRRPESTRWVQLALAVLYLLVAHIVVFSSQRYGFHYLLYLVHPLMVSVGIALAATWDAGEALSGRLTRVRLGVLVAVLAATSAVPQLQPDRPAIVPKIGISPVSRMILRVAHPGERMLVWGWLPRTYVETGLRMGTRDAIAQFSIMEWPLIDYYRERLLSDFRASRPEIFVDAVAPGVFLPKECNLRFETFRQLREIIEREYRLVAELSVEPNAKETVRIYRRRDARPIG